MSPRARGRTGDGSVLLLLLCAVMTVRLVVAGEHRNYVRNSMGPWLLLAGLGLSVGAVLVARSRRNENHHEVEHVHGHSGGRVGWLLLAPVLAVLVIAPRSLGTYAFDRAMTGSVESAGRGSFAPLPAGEGPAAMSMSEFDQRTADRDGESLAGREVRLVGFVARRGGEDVTIARFQIACCAADARPHIVLARGVDTAGLAVDQWVEISGRYVAGSRAEGIPVLELTGIRRVGAPADPYEDG